MSVSLDFSDMFAPTERLREKENFHRGNNFRKIEHIDFVKSTGSEQEGNYREVESIRMTENESEVVEVLILSFFVSIIMVIVNKYTQRLHLRDQVAIIASENDSLRYQILTLQREKEKDAHLIESLRQVSIRCHNFSFYINNI